MALTDCEKTDVRRYCGYPVWSGGVIEVFGSIAYQTTGTLEFRINNLTASEESVLRRYLGTLTVLEVAVPRAGENLDTDQAAVWTRNRTEPEDRLRLLDSWRRRLCHFLGVPPGPGLISGNSPALVV